MTGTQQVLLFVVIAALLTICGVVWLEHRRHAADEQAYEDELNQQFGGTRDETTATETLPPLPAEDLVGSDDRDRPVAAVSMARTGDDSPAVDTDTPDGAVSQDLLAADRTGSGSVADPAAGLTPAQRRRAVKKGRIPRTFPALGLVATIGAGELELAGPVSRPAPGPGEHHERIPQPLEVWDPLMRAWMPVFPTLLESARHEAHFRQWESEVGSLIDGAYTWLETAA